MSTGALDPLIHDPERLRIVATLAALPDGDALSVTRLQDMIRLPPGGLITCLRELGRAGSPWRPAGSLWRPAGSPWRHPAGGSASVPGGAAGSLAAPPSVSRICCPYLASLVSPTPLTLPSSARVAGDSAAIWRSVASWKIT